MHLFDLIHLNLIVIFQIILYDMKYEPFQNNH